MFVSTESIESAAAGWVMFAVYEVIQPFKSVIVLVYEPGTRLKTSCVVAPFDQA